MSTKDLKNTYCYYVRVSSKMQEQKGSYKNQIFEIKKYAKANGFILSDEYKDIMTGSKYDRLKLIKMMNNIDKYKGVIVAFIDRLGRDLVEQMRVFTDFIDSKIEIHVTDFGELDYASLEDQFKYIIESYFAAKENERHSKRIIQGIERYKRENDGQWGRKIKKINWERYDKLRKVGFSDPEIAKIFDIGRTTLYDKKKKRKKGEPK